MLPGTPQMSHNDIIEPAGHSGLQKYRDKYKCLQTYFIQILLYSMPYNIFPKVMIHEIPNVFVKATFIPLPQYNKSPLGVPRETFFYSCGQCPT